MSHLNLKELRELIDLISEKGFAEFELERQGFRLRIRRFGEPTVPVAQQPVVVPFAPMTGRQAEGPPPGPDTAGVDTRERPDTPEPPSPEREVALHMIKSPIVGTFYRSPSPDAEPFVKVGDLVKPDSVVCIIEAMKLMNEIQAEVSGEVVKLFVENGQPVEYGQPLFGVRA